MGPANAEAKDLRSRVEEVLEGLRPMLRMDGGDVEFLGIAEGVVRLRLVGACDGCPMSSSTLTAGIERALRQAIPEVERVEAD